MQGMHFVSSNIARAGAQANPPVGASLLAMEINDNAGNQAARVVHASIASRLAPQGMRVTQYPPSTNDR